MRSVRKKAMSELKQYLDKVSWTESVSQHKKAIIFIHDRQIKDLERQLEEARGLAESAIVEAFNAGADIYHLSKELEQLKEKGDE